MTSIQLSVEEFLRGFSVNDTSIQELLALNDTSSDDSNNLTPSIICAPCETIDDIDPRNCGIEKCEVDLYFPNCGRTGNGTTTNGIHPLTVDNFIQPLPQQRVRQPTRITLEPDQISLSRSVAVKRPKQPKNPSHAIQIVTDLEENYRARYKSDYFSQEGTIRKPRYVADQKKNHFVTIKVVLGARGYIRVDWVTIEDEKKMRYSMPYKFQIDNQSLDVLDCNPIYIPIDADSFGIMKLYLVLIKARQGELKNIQSLELFPPVQHSLATTNTIYSTNMPLRPPKQLIQMYHLDKSQLAFTFCALSPDGQSCIPEWDTTTYSTVLTETSSDVSKKRTATCPNCSYSFDIPMEDADDNGHETLTKKRKK